MYVLIINKNGGTPISRKNESNSSKKQNIGFENCKCCTNEINVNYSEQKRENCSRKTYAYLLHQKNEQSKALDELEKIIEKNPEDITALHLKAYILNYIGKLSESINTIDQILEIKPDIIEIFFMKMETLQCLNRDYEAEKVASKILNSNPENCHQWMFKAEVLSKRGYLYEANEAFRRAEQFDPVLANSTLTLANHFARFGEYENAIDVCNNALILEQNDEIYSFRAQVHFAKNDLKNALKDIDRAIKHRSDNIEHWKLKGYIEETKGELKKASDSYMKALMLDDSDSIALNRLYDLLY